ncbi:S-layer homology domain-containing protein [Paenibacillus sp. IHBB 10380]|uniref:S-layer homology domain-containing protein n=1 Tax=Paenibacillus sp. IHBB 10380 TaxID=1566358 RepID=UPI0005CFBCCC|nr:S-layer homology domain-containing protein [Paenibacillus sp. IHBB 10380]AJS61200.1 hypothetical protein UB51_25285 [Paenibacillus sp. IHBB 10380]
MQGLKSVGSSNFKDAKGHWAVDAIATLKASGIINGYSKGLSSRIKASLKRNFGYVFKSN